MNALRSFAILTAAETRRYLAETRVYLSGYISSLITTGIVISLFVLSGESSSDRAYWIGFLYWNASAMLVTESCISISSDKQSGTFTQLMLRPTSMLVQITVKTLTWSMVNIAVDVIFIVALFGLIGAPIGFSWAVVPIMAITFIGLFGLTMVMAALTVLYTKTASFCDLIGYVMLFLSGAVIPSHELPRALNVLGQALPITPGIAMSRAAILGHAPDPWEWLRLAGQSCAFVIAGYALFHILMAHGRRHGIRMRY